MCDGNVRASIRTARHRDALDEGTVPPSRAVGSIGIKGMSAQERRPGLMTA